MSLAKLSLIILGFVFIFEEVSGHGYIWKPVSRSSRWRFDNTAPPNYSDNELFCGGVGIQWGQYQGKCGVCGDSFSDKVPRANENTGTYGLGKVVETYKSGSVIDVNIRLTQTHKGYFSYSLCDLQNPSRSEEESCFQPLILADGTDKFFIDNSVFEYTNKVQLPAGKKCKRCVLRWTYRTGNSWGTCEDGTGAVGCGAQETYKNCADISIV